ncbi:hypothetical protein Taro_001749, partial [Colocasia esculenta]|nr:hypothetical protein [Colocasia esculenta]
VWLLEHTRLQRPFNKIVFPRILRWEAPKKRKVQVGAENLKAEQEEEERQENKKEEDKEETEEMSPSKWSKVMSEMRNELTCVVCRMEERDRQTRRELEEFGTKLDSIFKQLKSYMAERKSSTTGPENEAKDMTNMGQTEEGRGVSTSPAPMDVEELDKVVKMAANVGTLNMEEDKEEYKVIALNEKEDPEATISIKHGQPLLESRRDFCGQDLLPEEQKQIIHSFLCQTIDGTKVMNNRWDGYVTREHVHAILFGKLIVDDAIDIGFQFLMEKMEKVSNDYHICMYMPALLVHNFQSKKAKIPERVKLMKSSLPYMASKGDIEKVDLLFFVLFTSNHWHLLVVDVKKKRAMSYNSIKGSARYMATTKRWVTLLDAFFKFCGIMDDPLELIYDDQCLDQSSDSADCALFVIKFMKTISKKGEIEWKFSQADMPLMRAQFTVEILTYASAKT